MYPRKKKPEPHRREISLNESQIRVQCCSCKCALGITPNCLFWLVLIIPVINMQRYETHSSEMSIAIVPVHQFPRPTLQAMIVLLWKLVKFAVKSHKWPSGRSKYMKTYLVEIAKNNFRDNLSNRDERKPHVKKWFAKTSQPSAAWSSVIGKVGTLTHTTHRLNSCRLLLMSFIFSILLPPQSWAYTRGHVPPVFGN